MNFHEVLVQFFIKFHEPSRKLCLKLITTAQQTFLGSHSKFREPVVPL